MPQHTNTNDKHKQQSECETSAKVTKDESNNKRPNENTKTNMNRKEKKRKHLVKGMCARILAFTTYEKGNILEWRSPPINTSTHTRHDLSALWIILLAL